MYEAGFDQDDVIRLVAALRLEADGHKLTRDLRAGLRAAAEPAALAARASILAMPAHGDPLLVRSPERLEGSLRVGVAEGVRVEAILGLKVAGIQIAAHSSQVPRKFRNAPRRLESAKGWRHPFMGNRKRWYAQMGKPGWFSEPIKAQREEVMRVVAAALDAVAQRISARTKG